LGSVGGAYALCAYGTRKGAIAGTRQYAPFFYGAWQDAVSLSPLRIGGKLGTILRHFLVF
jgi:hypothetical protein